MRTDIKIEKVDFFSIHTMFTLTDKKEFNKLIKLYEELTVFHVKEEQFFITEDAVFWWKSGKENNKK